MDKIKKKLFKIVLIYVNTYGDTFYSEFDINNESDENYIYNNEIKYFIQELEREYNIKYNKEKLFILRKFIK